MATKYKHRDDDDCNNGEPVPDLGPGYSTKETIKNYDYSGEIDAVFPKRRRIIKIITGMKPTERDKDRTRAGVRWSWRDCLESYESACRVSMGPDAGRRSVWREIAWEREVVLVDRLNAEGHKV